MQDYNKLLELLPAESAQYQETKRALRLVTPRKEAAQKAETAEMLGKLKDMGNSLLGALHFS